MKILRQLAFLFLLKTAVAPAAAGTVQLGAGSYRTELPPAPDGTPRRSISASPLVSERISGAPVPTNDWWSSLVWPMHSPHSMAMFPHPLAVQAFGDGLGISYSTQPLISDHFKDGKAFQTGTNYRFPFRESLRVGLDGLVAESTLVDGYSDWAVTALWKHPTASDTLRATFAHGSPFVFFERDSDRPVRIGFSAAKVDPTKEPVAPYVHSWTGITAEHRQKPGAIKLSVNAGSRAGIGSKARLRYDFDGDGEFDRTETFKLFATDPVESSWESYAASEPESARGDMRSFENGSVRFEFWKCFGEGGIDLRPAESSVHLPDGSVRTPGEAQTISTGTGEARAVEVFHDRGHMVGVTVNGSHFGIFAPAGSELAIADDAIVTRLAGKDHLSVAALPDRKRSTFDRFSNCAFAFIRDTRVEYKYEPESGTVTSSFTVRTEAMEGDNTDTLFALYRHQHLNCTEPERFLDFSFVSPRGAMKVLSGKSFSTSIPFLGVLPALPNPEFDRSKLEADASGFRFTRDDTYWNGKEFGKVTELIQIADQIGADETRDQLLAQLRSRLEDWFDGEERYFFYYDDRWDTLTGYPDSYGSGEQLNDHHFHYSYFIRAAATIAQFDPDWVSEGRYGAMVDALIRDCANYDRGDQRFPWMRNFDPFAGHSWAAGHAGFASGNNQESSSESMNFATSLILYGQAIGSSEIRDLGIYWHSTEAEAIRHYWFDQDRKVFPSGFQQSCVGMVWGDGASYGTWWTANPEEIHGINFLPINGGSLYLGRDPGYVRRNLANLKDANRSFHTKGFPGDPEKFDRWQDILIGYLALADAAAAARLLPTIGESELGETKAHTHQWVGALIQLGTFDSSIRCDHPTAIAFENAYVVFNPAEEAIEVSFSDGKRVKAPGGLTSFKRE